MIMRKPNHIELETFDPGTNVLSMKFKEKGDHFHMTVQNTFKEFPKETTFVRDDLHLEIAECHELKIPEKSQFIKVNDNKEVEINDQDIDKDGYEINQNIEMIDVNVSKFDNTYRESVIRTQKLNFTSGFGEISAINNSIIRGNDITRYSKLDIDECWDRSILLEDENENDNSILNFKNN